MREIQIQDTTTQRHALLSCLTHPSTEAVMKALNVLASFTLLGMMAVSA